jgi:uncharacterized membrane protein
MPRPLLRLELLPLVVALLAVVLGAAAAFGAFGPLAIPPDAKPWLRVFARAHPILIHVPIALLLLALPCELLLRRRDGECTETAYWMLAIGTLSGAFAGASGWLHGALEPHSASAMSAIDAHRWWSIGAIALGLVGTIAGFAIRTRGHGGPLPFWRGGLLLSAAAVGIGSHLGGNLVYGEGHLLEPVIDAREARVAGDPGSANEVGTLRAAIPDVATLPSPGASFARVDFATQIWPLIDMHCVECHGAKKKKGLLRLDRWNARIAGGKKAVILPNNAAESDFLRRMCLPKDHEEFMPPEKDPLPAHEIELIRRWIDEGAEWPKTMPASAAPSNEPETAQPDTHGDGDGE